MQLRTVLAPAARGFNTAVVALGTVPVLGPRIRRSVAIITYVGRKSGRTISTPVAARRSGQQVSIGVAMPEQKTWWRNFVGEGAPLQIRFDEATHHGHALAHRDPNGKVTVQVTLSD